MRACQWAFCGYCDFPLTLGCCFGNTLISWFGWGGFSYTRPAFLVVLGWDGFGLLGVWFTILAVFPRSAFLSFSFFSVLDEAEASVCLSICC